MQQELYRLECHSESSTVLQCEGGSGRVGDWSNIHLAILIIEARQIEF